MHHPTSSPAPFSFFSSKSSTPTARPIVRTVQKLKPPLSASLAANTAALAPAHAPVLHTWSLPKPASLPPSPPKPSPPKRKRNPAADSGSHPKRRKQQQQPQQPPPPAPAPQPIHTIIHALSTDPANYCDNRNSTPSSTTAYDETTSDEEVDFTFSRAKPSSLQDSIGPFGSREAVVLSRFPIGTKEDGVVDAISSERVVKQLLPKYKTYFHNPEDPEDKSFENHPVNYPVVTLEYPNLGASERFILLVPVDEAHYNPITELIQAIHTIVGYCLLPEEQVQFGTLPFAVERPPYSEHNPYWDPPSLPVDYVDHLRNLTKSYHTRNGPLFLQTVKEISRMILVLKSKIMNNLRCGWKGFPPSVWQAIVEECYQRCVGPSVKELGKYLPFSNTVYGELNGPFVSDIIHRTALGPGKMFVDLGCGVANCLIQASLQCGCISNGIEINPPPAALAKLQVSEFEKRLRMWGVTSGDVTMREGDFLEHEDVRHWMANADVVLVNNWAFSPALNTSLSLLFLDLKEGAQIISLKPFRRPDFRLSDRTTGSPEAIYGAVEEVVFKKGTVSWTNEGGTYFLHTVDRRPLRKIEQERAEKARAGGSKRRRGRNAAPVVAVDEDLSDDSVGLRY